MKFYIAARFERIDEMNTFAEQLRQIGHQVDCRWLTGTHQLHPGAEQLEGTTGFQDDGQGVTMLAQPFAIDDVEDLKKSDAIIFFSELPESYSKRGGRHVEFGMAIAMGKRLFVVGQRENVFHCLPNVRRFNSWHECLGFFDIPEEVIHGQTV